MSAQPGHAETSGLGEVVVLLFRHAMKNAFVLLPEFLRKGVAVTDNGLRTKAAGNGLNGSAVAAAQEIRLLQNAERHRMNREIAVGEYYCFHNLFLIFSHLKYPATAITV